ncbi:MAG: alkaline phosphatase family protein [Chitinophagaceae bacterium]|nr:alkaline phosphatase family protein [Chitinophagaceae bacterium]
MSFPLFSQHGIISGPMLGAVEYRDAKIWVEVSKDVKSVSLQYNKKGDKKIYTQEYKGTLGNDFNPVQFTVGHLDYNTTYEYKVLINGKPATPKAEFTTKDLWQWRKSPPEFTFLTGSCSYFNEAAFDRPGIPYGKDSAIFETMAQDKASFMLWLGDNWYSREVDYYSDWGLWYRASRDRSLPVLQNFWKAMPHYAIWDDHDYGPNDIGKHYILKQTSREIWKKYWCNPSYGENEQGIYTMFHWGDVDFFLTDNRWWRSHDKIKDSVNGIPNPEKTMLGAQQMDWLKNSLLYSQARFKIIVMGSQALNPVSPYDKWRKYAVEFEDFLKFLKEYQIDGVLFLTGDRHHSEIIKMDREGTYPLYDITVSPLTSGTHTFGGPEKNNPYRILGIDQLNNYGKITVSGPANDRKLTVEFKGVKGNILGRWTISEKELKTPR